MRNQKLLPLVLDFARHNGSVITTPVILRLGGNSDAITRFLKAGVLVRVHQGVYVLGGTLIDHHVAVRAALAAAGREAVASHGSTAWFQGLIDAHPTQPQITTATAHRRLQGVTVHRSKSFGQLSYRGVPCTPPAR